jgi:hypothetical protein
MDRPIRIVVRLAVIYLAFSLIAGFVIAEMTLHPGRTHPNETSIAQMYAEYGAKLVSAELEFPCASALPNHGKHLIYVKIARA